MAEPAIKTEKRPSTSPKLLSEWKPTEQAACANAQRERKRKRLAKAVAGKA